MSKKEAKKHAGNGHKCKECAHHYDEHSKAIDGHMILCRCPYKMDNGKFCIFLGDNACEKFKAQ